MVLSVGGSCRTCRPDFRQFCFLKGNYREDVRMVAATNTCSWPHPSPSWAQVFYRDEARHGPGRRTSEWPRVQRHSAFQRRSRRTYWMLWIQDLQMPQWPRINHRYFSILDTDAMMMFQSMRGMKKQRNLLHTDEFPQLNWRYVCHLYLCRCPSVFRD